jgi:hypothetical protein
MIRKRAGPYGQDSTASGVGASQQKRRIRSGQEEARREMLKDVGVH